MSHDLLVYGSLAPRLDGLTGRWTAIVDAMGAEVRFHPDFEPAFHSGHLPASLVVHERGLEPFPAPAARLRVGFDLYFEWFDANGAEETGEGLKGVAPDLATTIRHSSFCAVFTLSVEDSPGCAICAFFAAVGLARLTNGVIVDPQEDTHWDSVQALRGARSFFSSTFPLHRCQAADRPFDGW